MKKINKGTNTVLDEIKFLRGMRNFMIDTRNSNRYRIMAKENLGKTAYCFSTPIYNTETRQLVNRKFKKTKTGYLFYGSNGKVTVWKNKCILENKNGKAFVTLNKKLYISKHKGKCNSKIEVFPTLNGICFSVKATNLNFLLETDESQQSVFANSSCFSVLSEKFKPFLSIATLYAKDKKGNMAPVELKHYTLENHTYQLDLSHQIKDGIFCFEINLYEGKLFQDTTVESAHPDANNAYGAIGFIGKTKHFGEQWLYSRLDLSKIIDLTSQQIDKAFLHIPCHSNTPGNLEIFIPRIRFCSLGTTWNNKANISPSKTTSSTNGKYITIDVTSLITDKSGYVLDYNEGLVVKTQGSTDGFVAISTGDCYWLPQILEIKLK